MAITGRVDYSSAGITSRTPNGCWALVGEDGKHYVAAGSNLTSGLLKVGCAETNAFLPTISATDWETAVLTAGGSISGNYSPHSVLPCPGTPYVGVIGVGADNLVNDMQVVIAIWKVNAAGSLEFVGVTAYLSDGNLDLDAAGNIGNVDGTVAVDGEVYFTFCPHFDTNSRVALGHIPYAGPEIDLTPGAWEDRCTVLPAEFQSSASRGLSRGSELGSVRSVGDGIIRVFQYLPAEGGGPELLAIDVNPSAQTTTAVRDLTSDFSSVFASAGLKYDGSVGTFSDDFIAPFLDGIEVGFTRPFTDEINTGRIIRATVDSLDGLQSGVDDFEILGTSEPNGFTITSVNIALEALHAHRDGDYLLLALRDRRFFYFYEIYAPLGECVSSGFDLIYPPCVTKWTQCVRIARRDGTVFRFTTLDRDFDFRGETYLTCNSLDTSAAQTFGTLGDVGNAELQGILATAGIDDADLYGGLFDDAFCEIWRVPYEGEDKPRRLSAGWVGKVSQSVRGYKAEVLGPGSRLEQRPIVQVYTPQCRWTFGDERCGVDIDALAIGGTVTSGLNRGVFTATLGPEPIGSGTGEVASSGDVPAQFADGRIRWLTGVNAGQVTEVQSVDFDTGLITLWALTAHIPEVGDTFDLMPGCAQDFDTCRTIYDNGINFGGFPHVPGTDAIMRSPNAKSS